jgi:transposase
VIRRHENWWASNGPAIALREFGRLEIRPRAGWSWGSRANHFRASAIRRHTARHRLVFHGIHENRLWDYSRPREWSREVLEALKTTRRPYPSNQRIHLILDNAPLHGTPAIPHWSRRSNRHMVWTPTNASSLNPIECQFTPVREFVIRNPDYDNREELADALRRYVDYRTQDAKQKKSQDLIGNGTT